MQGEACRKVSFNYTDPQEFECPKLFQSKRKIYCCNINTPRATCCEHNPQNKSNENISNYILLLSLGCISGLLFGLILYVCRVCERLPIGHNDNPHLYPGSSSHGNGYTCSGGSSYRVAYHVNRTNNAMTNTTNTPVDDAAELDSAPPPYDVIFPETQPLKNLQTQAVTTQPTVSSETAGTNSVAATTVGVSTSENNNPVVKNDEE